MIQRLESLLCSMSGPERSLHARIKQVGLYSVGGDGFNGIEMSVRISESPKSKISGDGLDREVRLLCAGQDEKLDRSTANLQGKCL